MIDPQQETQIIRVVRPRFASDDQAREWYRSQKLPGFSGATAMQLVAHGRADEVLAYIAAVDAGVHA